MHRVSVAVAEWMLIVLRRFTTRLRRLAAVNCRGCTVVSIYDFLGHGPDWEDSRIGSFPRLLIAERASFGCSKEHATTRGVLNLGVISPKKPSVHNNWRRYPAVPSTLRPPAVRIALHVADGVPLRPNER